MGNLFFRRGHSNSSSRRTRPSITRHLLGIQGFRQYIIDRALEEGFQRRIITRALEDGLQQNSLDGILRQILCGRLELIQDDEELRSELFYRAVIISILRRLNPEGALTEEELSECIETNTHRKESLDDSSAICVICQDEYVEGDAVGTLRCEHEYHADCIRRWFALKNYCPVCKATAT